MCFQSFLKNNLGMNSYHTGNVRDTGMHVGVSKNRDTPKWMVYNGKPIKMDDLGVPLFLETTMCLKYVWLNPSENTWAIHSLEIFEVMAP